MPDLKPLLDEGLQTLGLSLPSSTRDQLIEFIALIKKWNQAYNLTAIHDLRSMLIQHVFDSLVIIPYLQGQRVLDVGSGAGLPGIPLALACSDLQLVLLDSNQKKTTFITHALLTLGIKNIQVINNRVESFHFEPCFDTIVTRATVSLKEFANKTRHLVCVGGQLLAMKGKYPQSELDEINAPAVIYRLKVPKLDAERHLVLITN